MWNKIEKFIGQHCVFRLDGIVMSGYFCGIGEVNGNYGMIFIGVNQRGPKISETSSLFVHPLQIKCTLQSDIISLRRTCRKIFRRHKLQNSSTNIYFPTFEINEITHEKGIEAKG